MNRPTVEYYKGIYYLKRNAFWEMMVGVWFSFTAALFLISTICATFLLDPGAVIVGSLAFLFFVYLADNCFKQEIKYKCIITMRKENLNES